MSTLLASGRDADVYAIGPRRVLRRYRDGSDVAPEATVMAHARAHGIPVPAVLRTDGPDLEMERIDGAADAASNTLVSSRIRVVAAAIAAKVTIGSGLDQARRSLTLSVATLSTRRGAPIPPAFCRPTTAHGQLD